MLLRAFVVSWVLVIGGSLPGLAQQQIAPERPAGTVTRPEDGVQHPDLDKPWADYDAAVAKVTESIKAAITKQFDSATAKGDLDAAVKWQNALAKFEKAGELPADNETKAAVSIAAGEYKKAREELTKAYEALVKSLTIQKKINEAEAARVELRNLTTVLVWIEAGSYRSTVPRKSPARNDRDRANPDWGNLTIPGDSTLYWDVDVPRSGNFFIHVLYASGDERPCDVSLNGKIVAENVLKRVTGGLMPGDLKWETLGPMTFTQKNELAIDPKAYGPHLSRIVISSSRQAPRQD